MYAKLWPYNVTALHFHCGLLSMFISLRKQPRRIARKQPRCSTALPQALHTECGNNIPNGTCSRVRTKRCAYGMAECKGRAHGKMRSSVAGAIEQREQAAR